MEQMQVPSMIMINEMLRLRRHKRCVRRPTRMDSCADSSCELSGVRPGEESWRMIRQSGERLESRHLVDCSTNTHHHIVMPVEKVRRISAKIYEAIVQS